MCKRPIQYTKYSLMRVTVAILAALLICSFVHLPSCDKNMIEVYRVNNKNSILGSDENFMTKNVLNRLYFIYCSKALSFSFPTIANLLNLKLWSCGQRIIVSSVSGIGKFKIRGCFNFIVLFATFNVAIIYQ